MTEDDKQQILKVMDTAGKLLFEVKRLRADVQRLHDRIQPFEGEQMKDPGFADMPAPRNLSEALQRIDLARRAVVSAEYHLNAIRGSIDGIASDAISRAELKPWLKR